MNPQAKKIILIAIGAIALITISSFATVEAISLENKPALQPVAVAAPPAPVAPPAPQMAQVIGVKPHYTTFSKPEEHCYQKPETVYPQQNTGINNMPIAGAVIGGVTGGLAGSVINGKSHNAAIVAGAALGAITGGAVQKQINQPKPQTVYVTKCSSKTVKSKVQQGYEVSYVYNGVQGMTIMDAPPSSNLIPPPYPTNYVAPAPAGQPAYYYPAPAPATAPVQQASY